MSEIFVKTFNNTFHRSAFATELKIYQRLEGADFIPKLINWNQNLWQISIEHVGPTIFDLEKIGQRIYIPDLDQQLERVADFLESRKVVHLDAHRKNTCYRNSRIYLIDWEKAVIDPEEYYRNKTRMDNSRESMLYRRYQKFLRGGGYRQYFVRAWRESILRSEILDQ
jgi:predicted Ser/Thr protein kinase